MEIVLSRFDGALGARLRLANIETVAGSDPIVHAQDLYCTPLGSWSPTHDGIHGLLDFGWKEFRNPGPNFDTTYYLTHNIDVAKSGLNPLVHFIRFGAVEGRRPQHGVSNA